MRKQGLRFVVLLSLLVVGALTACQKQEARTLTVITHDSFAISEEVIRQFEAQNDVTVSFVLSGDTGSTLNKAILTKDAPLGDVLYGVDNTFLSRALEEDIFEIYQSPQLENIPAEFNLDQTYHALPVDYGDVCINYDKAFFAGSAVPVPQNLDDLLDPVYKGMLVVENPAVSSPGLAFLLATIAQYGEEGYLDYWQQLKDNDVVVVNDWETAYYSNFSASSGLGPQPMVVSYATSPAAEVIFATEELDDAPTASITGDNACFRQIEFVGILKGTPNLDLAQKFVDYMLSVPFQQDIPMNMFVLPVNGNAQLPAEFEAYIQIPELPASLPYKQIAASRETWVQAWQDVVLQ